MLVGEMREGDQYETLYKRVKVGKMPKEFYFLKQKTVIPEEGQNWD